MKLHELISVCCLGISILVTWLSCIALMVMKDTYQRLNYSSALAAVSVPLVTLAIWLRSTDPQMRIKVVLINVILFFTNAVLTHATGRAYYIRSNSKEEGSA